MSAESASAAPNSVHETLGIQTLEMGPDRVVLELHVGPHVHQPMGLLHGGVSAILAESAASLGAFMNCEPDKQFVVGTDLNISHLRSVRTGVVRAVGTPIRKGRRVHVWGIEIVGEDGTLVAVARCTLAVRDIDSSGQGG